MENRLSKQLQSHGSYLDIQFGDHASLESKRQILLLEDLVDLLGLEDEVFEVDVAAEETNV